MTDVLFSKAIHGILILLSYVWKIQIRQETQHNVSILSLWLRQKIVQFEKENISVFTLIPGSKICVLSATSARTLDGCQLD